MMQIVTNKYFYININNFFFSIDKISYFLIFFKNNITYCTFFLNMIN